LAPRHVLGERDRGRAPGGAAGGEILMAEKTIVMAKLNQILMGLALLLCAAPLAAQSCYIQLDDATGLPLPPAQLAELEAAACELRAAFPVEFQNDFAVYDFGFYLHQEGFAGGVPEVFQAKVAEVEVESAYFLLFGRQLSRGGGVSEVWVEVRLPEGALSCVDPSWELRFSAQVRQLSADWSVSNLFEHQVQSIEKVKEVVMCKEICDNGIDDDGDGWIDCNDPDCFEFYQGLRTSNICNAGQAIFKEHQYQKFGFDNNKIKAYPTYVTPIGKGVPWKSLGVGVEDQVDVEFSDQLVLSDLTYVATGIEIIGSTTPQGYTETITLKGNALTGNAKIEVKDNEGNVIGGLMVKVLPAKSMILNLVLMKLPEDESYPNVNFTISEMQTVLNNCFKQVNMTWTVNQIDQYEYDFDLNHTKKLDDQEDWDILHNYIRINHTQLYKNKYWPNENPSLFQSTSTYILYDKIQSSSEGQTNGWTRKGDIYGVVDCSYQHNKRTMAHENGHRVGYEHPWKEFLEYTEFDDTDALMDYVNILTGYKIRAYQWTN
jgi:hypothetical protein